MDERIKAYDVKMTKSYNNLLEEFGAIRAGRANPHVLDRITVEYYGTPTPLQQVGNVTVPEPRMIQIQPWDASLIKEICKAIQTSDLGINPNTDGKVIRLVFPELTEERRKDLVKEVKKKGEGAKVAVRNIRRDANDAFKKLGKGKEVSEDEVKELEENIPEADRQVHQGYRQGYRGEIKRDHDRVVLEGKYWVNTGMLQCGIPAFLHTGGFVYEYSTTCSNHSGRQRTLGKEQRDAA